MFLYYYKVMIIEKDALIYPLLTNDSFIFMKYGRHQIDKAGETILSSKNQDEVSNAIEKVNDWRTLHLPALDALQNTLIPLLKKKKVSIDFTSRRLKRLTSILYKLDINPEMKLGGMQDIGGLRIVVPTVDALNRALDVLKENVPDGFELVKVMNYIEIPKTSGYRSIHFIYKFDSNNSDTNGMKVELQIRTKLQHSWAMAVETAGLITSTPLKSSQGSDEWLKFFKVVSSLFAIKEHLPILTEHIENGYDMKALMKILYNMNKAHNHCDTLKALRVSNIQAQKENYQNGYYILNINFKQQVVNVTAFSKKNEEEATMMYSELEKQAQDSINAVVLVSVPKMKELQEAYPSYFLNTTEFLMALDTMIENCEKLRWV